MQQVLERFLGWCFVNMIPILVPFEKYKNCFNFIKIFLDKLQNKLPIAFQDFYKKATSICLSSRSTNKMKRLTQSRNTFCNLHIKCYQKRRHQNLYYNFINKFQMQCREGLKSIKFHVYRHTLLSTCHFNLFLRYVDTICLALCLCSPYSFQNLSSGNAVILLFHLFLPQ